MLFRIPQSLKAEHEELHGELAQATKAGGRTGQAAQAVARLMHPHFLKEEEYALPPLGLLAELAKGKIETRMAAVLTMTDKLEAELPTMLLEHKEIVAALEDLIDAAKAENKPDYARFADKLMAHARTEEEVTYPTALLIGRYLKVSLPSSKIKAA
jgi:hemerythrin HHE cation binding domain-containing protein